MNQVIFAVCIVVLVAYAVLFFFRRAKLRRARNWPIAAGQVESTDVTLKSGGGQPGSAAYYAEVRYTYSVDGQAYAGRVRRRFILKGSADKWVAKLAQSDPLKVRYNPAKSDDSVVLEGDHAAVAPGEVHAGLVILLAVLGITCRAGFAQVTSGSSDYTAAPPSVQRIESEIKGTDPTDTLARQIAVFRSLQNYISNIQYARSVKVLPSPGDCGNAHVNAIYMVADTPTGFIVHAQNAGGPASVPVGGRT